MKTLLTAALLAATLMPAPSPLAFTRDSFTAVSVELRIQALSAKSPASAAEDLKNIRGFGPGDAVPAGADPVHFSAYNRAVGITRMWLSSQSLHESAQAREALESTIGADMAAKVYAEHRRLSEAAQTDDKVRQRLASVRMDSLLSSVASAEPGSPEDFAVGIDKSFAHFLANDYFKRVLGLK